MNDRSVLPGRAALAEVQASDQTEIRGREQRRRGRREREVDDRPRQLDWRPGRSAVRREQVYSPGGVRDRERAAERVERDRYRSAVDSMLPTRRQVGCPPCDGATVVDISDDGPVLRDRRRGDARVQTRLRL